MAMTQKGKRMMIEQMHDNGRFSEVVQKIYDERIDGKHTSELVQEDESGETEIDRFVKDVKALNDETKFVLRSLSEYVA